MKTTIEINLENIDDTDLLDFFFYAPFGDEDLVEFKNRNDDKVDKGIYYNLGLMKEVYPNI